MKSLFIAILLFHQIVLSDEVTSSSSSANPSEVYEKKSSISPSPVAICQRTFKGITGQNLRETISVTPVIFKDWEAAPRESGTKKVVFVNYTWENLDYRSTISSRRIETGVALNDVAKNKEDKKSLNWQYDRLDNPKKRENHKLRIKRRGNKIEKVQFTRNGNQDSPTYHDLECLPGSLAILDEVFSHY